MTAPDSRGRDRHPRAGTPTRPVLPMRRRDADAAPESVPTAVPNHPRSRPVRTQTGLRFSSPTPAPTRSALAPENIIVSERAAVLLEVRKEIFGAAEHLPYRLVAAQFFAADLRVASDRNISVRICHAVNPV